MTAAIALLKRWPDTFGSAGGPREPNDPIFWIVIAIAVIVIVLSLAEAWR